jgi:class 3 adenylate cyclase/tetratricopeptide (TPR) repeat protein
MRCTKCGTESMTGRKFCAACGSPLSSRCPKCDAENAPTSTFCEDCGTSLAGNAISAATRSSQTVSTAPNIRVTAEQPGTPTTDGERKTVTALFADIKGSMDLMEDIDPEEARAIVDPALRLMMDAVHRYGGYIVQSTGDGIFALFGAPVAHEDHPQCALYSALRMQEDVKRYAEKLRAEKGVNLQVRVGVNTGEVVVRSLKTDEAHTEYTPIGHSTSLASRLQALAAPGSIAISETVRKLVEGYFALKPLGPARIKGVSEPVNVYEATGLGPLRTRLQRSASRGYTKFVGRQLEMEAMKAAADLAKAGRGQIVAAMAEPGVGKSRLLFEFKAKNQFGWTVMETVSVSHGKASAYFPVIDLLHGYFKIASEDNHRARRVKVNGNVLTLDRTLEDTLPYLFSLLGIVEGDDPLAQMDGQIKRRRTLEAIKRLLLRESLNQPLMVIFEDLHWIDDETQAFLNLIADSIGTAKILLLVNYRPDYSHQWGSKTYYTQLRLDPLGAESADEMLTAILGEGKDLTPLKQRIIARTEGNPFFMEETVQALIDEGALVRNGAAHLTRPLAELKIPSTVQGILAARIDRLKSDAKDLLQTLGVIGREFSLSLIRTVVAKSDDELNRLLNDLQLGEFIYEQPAVGDAEYIFKHALTQQVAHDSMLLERRRQLHERVAVAIEALYEEHIDEHLAQLANHYRQSRNIDKAVHFLRRAAEQAADRSALAEAESHLREAIGLLTSLSTSSNRDLLELELQTALARLLIGKSFGGQEREEPLRRAYQLCEQVADSDKLLSVLFLLVQFNIQRMRLDEAQELAGQELALVQNSVDPVLEAAAWYNVGESSFWYGDLKKSHVHLERAFALVEEISPNALIRAYGLDYWYLAAIFLATTELLFGRPARAIALEARALERAASSSHPYSKIVGIAFSAFPAQVRGEWKQVGERALTARPMCDEFGFLEGAGMTKQFGGWASFRSGERARGVSEMGEAIEELRGLGSLIMSTWRFVLLADAQIELTNYDAADAAVADAFENLERTREGWCEAEVYRVAGELKRRMPGGDLGVAEERYRQAIETALKQGAKWWELRATTSLARLLRDTGRRGEARAMLAGIYNWFTEGFDTTDLKSAKSLLDELSA